MTISILNDILLIKDKPLQEWYAYFGKINVTTFDNIIKKFAAGNHNAENQAKNVVLFILCAYDECSPMVVSRQERPEELNNICEFLNIPEYQRHALIYNEDADVRSAITKYLTQFAGPIFRNYMFLKMQLMDFQLMITNKSYGSAEEIKGKDDADKSSWVYTYDIKEHSKAVQQTRLLEKDIDLLEKQMKKNTVLKGIADMDLWKPATYIKARGNRGNPESLVRDTNNHQSHTTP